MNVSDALRSPPQLSRYVLESPQQKSSLLQTQARWRNIAAKVCLAAFLAIVGAAIAISVGVPLSIPPAFLVALVIGTIPLQAAFSYFQGKASEYQALSEIEQKKANELIKIANWPRKQIESFFQEHRISPASLPLDALRKVNPKEPLKALLPAIASFRHWRQEAETCFGRFKENLENHIADPHLRLSSRRYAWQILEKQAIPAFLNAAFMLQIITNPFLQIEWENFGTLRAKEFDERTWDEMLDKSNDYFIFSAQTRPPLAFEKLYQLLAASDADSLRQQLFEPTAEKSGG